MSCVSGRRTRTAPPRWTRPLWLWPEAVSKAAAPARCARSGSFGGVRRQSLVVRSEKVNGNGVGSPLTLSDLTTDASRLTTGAKRHADRMVRSPRKADGFQVAHPQVV